MEGILVDIGEEDSSQANNKENEQPKVANLKGKGGGRRSFYSWPKSLAEDDDPFGILKLNRENNNQQSLLSFSPPKLNAKTGVLVQIDSSKSSQESDEHCIQQGLKQMSLGSAGSIGASEGVKSYQSSGGGNTTANLFGNISKISHVIGARDQDSCNDDVFSEEKKICDKSLESTDWEKIMAEAHSVMDSLASQSKPVRTPTLTKIQQSVGVAASLLASPSAGGDNSTLDSPLNILDLSSGGHLNDSSALIPLDISDGLTPDRLPIMRLVKEDQLNLTLSPDTCAKLLVNISLPDTPSVLKKKSLNETTEDFEDGLKIESEPSSILLSGQVDFPPFPVDTEELLKADQGGHDEKGALAVDEAKVGQLISPARDDAVADKVPASTAQVQSKKPAKETASTKPTTRRSIVREKSSRPVNTRRSLASTEPRPKVNTRSSLKPTDKDAKPRPATGPRQPAIPVNAPRQPSKPAVNGGSTSSTGAQTNKAGSGRTTPARVGSKPTLRAAAAPKNASVDPGKAVSTPAAGPRQTRLNSRPGSAKVNTKPAASLRPKVAADNKGKKPATGSHPVRSLSAATAEKRPSVGTPAAKTAASLEKLTCPPSTGNGKRSVVVPASPAAANKSSTVPASPAAKRSTLPSPAARRSIIPSSATKCSSLPSPSTSRISAPSPARTTLSSHKMEASTPVSSQRRLSTYSQPLSLTKSSFEQSQSSGHHPSMPVLKGSLVTPTNARRKLEGLHSSVNKQNPKSGMKAPGGGPLSTSGHQRQYRAGLTEKFDQLSEGKQASSVSSRLDQDGGISRIDKNGSGDSRASDDASFTAPRRPPLLRQGSGLARPQMYTRGGGASQGLKSLPVTPGSDSRRLPLSLGEGSSGRRPSNPTTTGGKSSTNASAGSIASQAGYGSLSSSTPALAAASAGAAAGFTCSTPAPALPALLACSTPGPDHLACSTPSVQPNVGGSGPVKRSGLPSPIVRRRPQ